MEELVRRPSVQIGARYLIRGVGTVWRVDKILRDGIHVVLVNVEDRTTQKTISSVALVKSDDFLPQSLQRGRTPGKAAASASGTNAALE
jgi:hypothetical protein